MSSIGKRIKDRRIEIGMTQDELAKRMGYTSKTTISKIELGRNDIPQSKIVQFADVLKTTPTFLMGWDDERQPQEEHHHYLNPETEEMAQEIADNPDLHMLFSALRDSQPDDLKLVADMVKRFKGID